MYIYIYIYACIHSIRPAGQPLPQRLLPVRGPGSTI